MPDDALSTPLADLERLFLRALCAGAINEVAWQAIRRTLADYVWREPDHAVVYEAIVRVRGRDSRNWREQLPAQTTRMGFPDLDWTIYFNRSGAPDPNIDELVRKLKAAAAREA